MRRSGPSSEMAELHFLAAKLRMKIESFSPNSPNYINLSSFEGKTVSLAQDSLSAQLNLQVDQLTMQNHTLERENVELKSTCQKFSNELLLLESKNLALNQEIQDKTEEIREVRQKYDQLAKDSVTFESYLDSLQTDEHAVKVIAQKIQDAYQLTREELSKVTTQHKETLKSLKMYTNFYQSQQFLTNELQSRVVELQSKVEKSSTSNAQYLAKEGAFAEEKVGFQRYISRLESTIELLKQNQIFGSQVDLMLNTIKENTSSWFEKATIISEELEKLREILLQRNASSEAAQQKEIQDLCFLLQQREREYQHIFSNLGISYSTLPLGATSSERERKGLETPVEAVRKDSPHQSFPMKRLSEAPQRRDSPKPPTIGNDSLVISNIKQVSATPTILSSECPLCKEGPYGLMKICRKCGNQFHSGCAKKFSTTNTSRSFQCPICEK